MKFKLLEVQYFPSADDEVKNAEREYKEDIKMAKSLEEKDIALQKLIAFWVQKGNISENFLKESYDKIRKTMIQSFDIDGYSNTNNKFLKYILENSEIIKAEDAGKVSLLQRLINNDIIDYSSREKQKWLSDSDLYNRPLDEFEYTVKIFDIANNKSKISRWFKKTEYEVGSGKNKRIKKISTEDLYFNNKIKESGLHNHSNPKEQTIWNQVETWARKAGETNKDSKDREFSKDRKFSINDYLYEKFPDAKSNEDKVDAFISILKDKELATRSLSSIAVYLKASEDTASEIFNLKEFSPNFERREFIKFLSKNLKDIIG